MLSPQLRQLIRPLVVTQQIIWVVITGSILFYFGVIYLLAVSQGSYSPFRLRGVETILYTAAFLVSVSSVYFRQRSLSDKTIRRFLKNGLDLEELATDPRTKKTDSEKLSRLMSLSDFEQKVYSLIYRLQRITFINLFLNEVVVIIGFVLAFLSGEPGKIIPFGVVSFLLSIWMYPQTGKITERARDLYSA